MGIASLSLRDPQNLLLGSTSRLTTRGICFFSNRMLVCVLPLTGELLWQRNDIPVGCELSSDEEFVYVAQPTGERVRVFRLTDGSETEELKIAPPERRLVRRDDMLLSWQQAQLDKTALDKTTTDKTPWSCN